MDESTTCVCETCKFYANKCADHARCLMQDYEVERDWWCALFEMDERHLLTPDEVLGVA